MAKTASSERRMIILGGSRHHRGGLEAFCERAAIALPRHAANWQATWWPTDTAYFSLRHLGALVRAWRRLGRVKPREVDLIWLQWSTFADLLFLRRALALGIPVMATPHLGANARLQRVPVLRALSTRLLARADRIALLFAGQDTEIALPSGVPRTVTGSFLPETALSARRSIEGTAPLKLIHASRLSHGKGTFRMVALCATLRAQGIAFHAQIAGRADPATMAELRQAIADADLGASLTLTDWMNEAALIDALERTDILVHLSELDSFPLIVLEALAAGTMPIVADMTGARAMAERYGGFVATGTDGGVTAAADWLATQDLADLRHRAADVAAAVRREQAWESCVGRVVDAANTTIEGRNANRSLRG
ncbi:glycosyltransferase [Sphingomonas abietis]|uniref:Glycosyltransferase n=1 Tax=Sphingomonas abietis TaxID=3012344 RepID=A0ABY7NH26_9SPHN|nr:glycosyltransferase [Sphingomonas abietis]WBO20846.1 glycosyltransferase [Sphingomonas abietis]